MTNHKTDENSDKKLMAQLFDVTVPTINEHLKNIFSCAELEPISVIRKFRTTASELIMKRMKGNAK